MNILPASRTPLTGLWRARVKFVASREPTHALSLSYNEPTALPRIRYDLRRLHAWLDRRLLGRRFNRLPASARTWFAGCAENLRSNAHVHLALRPPPDREADVEALFAGYPNPWRQFAAHASHKLQPLHDAEGWIAYALDELTASGEWILSDEFLPLAVRAA